MDQSILSEDDVLLLPLQRKSRAPWYMQSNVPRPRPACRKLQWFVGFSGEDPAH